MLLENQQGVGYCSISASAPSSVCQSPAYQCQLTNGLTVIHQQIETAPVVAVDIWVKAGAIAEPEPWSGMAHFLEHMIFKGSDRQAPGSFDQLIENYGGVTNAATSHDYAHFFINTAAEQLPDMLPFFADLLLNAAIPAEEFELERDVVLEEIRQYQDDPDASAMQVLMETLYQHHPYGRSILGEASGLLSRSPGEMRQFHRCHYQPANMTLVMVGNIAQAEALALVERAFTDSLACSGNIENLPVNPTQSPGKSSPQMSSLQPTPVPIAPPLTDIRRQELWFPRLECARLMMAWIGPGVNDLRSAYGLDLLSVILAGGRTARLVRELREERQLVLDITSQFSLQRDSSMFTITAWLELEHLGQVEAIIGDRLFALAETGISAAECHRAKRLLCNDFAFSTETASQLAGLYGYYQTIAPSQSALHYPQVIESLTPPELQQLAKHYLSPLHYAVTTLQPA